MIVTTQSSSLLRSSALKNIKNFNHNALVRPNPLNTRRPFAGKSISSLTIKPPEKKNILQVPVAPQIAVMKYMKYMTQGDQADIKHYKTIYFIRNEEPVPAQQKFAATSRTDESFKIFKFEKGAHIAFRYEQIEVIGSGTYGIVLKCYDHKQKKDVSIKVMSCIEQKQNDLEVEFMKRLDAGKGPNNNYTVDLYGYFNFRGYNCIVTELLSLNLYHYLTLRKFNGFTIQEVRYIGLQVAKALQYIHNQNIVHSDMKPENIAFVYPPQSTPITHNKIKIIDFGCSCYDRQPLYKVVQSLYYRCPEVIFNFKYARQIDVWSFGCIIYELATGSPLFRCKVENDLIREIANLLGLPPSEMVSRSEKMQQYFKLNQRVNRENCNLQKLDFLQMKLASFGNSKQIKRFAELIGGCLEWLPAKRLTMDDVVKHPFFTSFDL